MASEARHVALMIETSESCGMRQLRGIRRYMSERGCWSVQVEQCSVDSEASSWVVGLQSDGILTQTSSSAMADAAREANVPTVEIRSSEQKTGLPSVGVDNQAVGQVIANYLLLRGFRHFGVLSLNSEDGSQQRCESFVASIQEADFDCDVSTKVLGVEGLETWKKQQRELSDWVASLQKPVALMACTDELGHRLLEACKQAGVAVPVEAAVVGVGNEESLCTISTPPLSSMQLDDERTGYEAAALLDRLMNGASNSKAPMLISPKEIITRESSDIVAIDDPDVAAAIQFIRERACKGISLEDVLATVPISRSSLERGMRNTIGRTPQVEINRIRLNRAKVLLAQTNLTLEEIAQKTAFKHPQYLSEVFKQRFSVTPGTFRKQAQDPAIQYE